MTSKIFIFGFGYVADALAKVLQAQSFAIAGTSRNPEKRSYYHDKGYEIVDFAPEAVEKALIGTTHLLISTSQRLQEKDPVLSQFTPLLNTITTLQWIGYFSTTGVYGDYQGEWVTEASDAKGDGERAKNRITAEQDWLEWGKARTIPTHIFRLAGIYGKGRSVIEQLRAGKNQAIYKQDQVFSRIHVKDIVHIVENSIKTPEAGIYNVCDDEPSAAYEVMQYAATLMQLPPPALVPYETANLSDMAQEFYRSNRRVSNAKMKKQWGINLLYPTYREGLKNILAES